MIYVSEKMFNVKEIYKESLMSMKRKNKILKIKNLTLEIIFYEKSFIMH